MSFTLYIFFSPIMADFSPYFGVAPSATSVESVTMMKSGSTVPDACFTA